MDERVTLDRTTVMATSLSPRAVQALAEMQAAHDDPSKSMGDLLAIARRWEQELLDLPEVERVRWGWETFRYSFRTIIGREPAWDEFVANIRLREALGS